MLRRRIKNYQKLENNAVSEIAAAYIKGSAAYPGISGSVKFLQVRKGVMVTAEISGLPHSQESCKGGIFGFHIHEGASCSGNAEDAFADVKTHYNPDGCAHPYHAGDMPPLFENNGYAYMSFLTDRFNVSDIIGRTVVIHSGPDDFNTQPGGNSGKKIACGEIRQA